MAWCWQEETAVLGGGKPVPLPFCPQHIPHGLVWFESEIPRWGAGANCLSHCGRHDSCREKCFRLRGRPETFGRPGESNNLAPLLTMFFKICYLREGRRVFLRARVQIENNSRINFYACRKLSLLAPYFKLCQWCLGAPYSWAPAAAARLVRPFVQPWSSGLWRRVSIWGYMCVFRCYGRTCCCHHHVRWDV